jgi:hypothetical protein
MSIQYRTARLLVKNIGVSRKFYEALLGQKVEYDFGEDIVFKGGFTIHDANHFSHIVFQRLNPYVQDKLGKENFEL